MHHSDTPVFTALFRPAVPMTARAKPLPGSVCVSSTLSQGTTIKRGGLPLPCDIMQCLDIPVILRDGSTIYVDVFRPAGSSPVPSIVAWSPYGKGKSTHTLDDFPGRAGVPRKLLSGLEKFEGPDPAYWCNHGYAVINPDPRGVCRSEGDIAFWGTQEGRDGHDLIEWIAEQAWSNGKVGLSGNSWLALSQWFIAAEKPAHLAAIAPWEGVTDLYRETICRGGIPETAFTEFVVGALVGSGKVEDPVQALHAMPFWNDYWADKRAAIERIDIPAYVVASWTNQIHVWGALRGFQDLGSDKKWLRIHDTHEWADYYGEEQTHDLRLFYDRFLKGIANGWEKTPRVRMTVLNPGHRNIVNRPESTFPLPHARERRFYLNSQDQSLHDEPLAVSANSHYLPTLPADTGNQARGKNLIFTYRFDCLTELNGYIKLKLWVEAQGADNMDLFVYMKKLDIRGQPLPIPIIPVSNPVIRFASRLLYRRGAVGVAPLYTYGPSGRLRVSLRELDTTLSTPHNPVLACKQEKRLTEGEVVPIEIALRPIAWRFHRGEQLLLEISGHDKYPVGLPGVGALSTCNQGMHIIHTGGRHDSHLLMSEISCT